MNMQSSHWSTAGWAVEGRNPKIAIIGAGLSGVGAVVMLRKSGYTDITVYEKADKVGGTWRENTYPGLSCDVASHWYCYRFERNPNWTHRYPYGPEIFAYIDSVADKYDVKRDIKFNTAVKTLTYEGPHWRLETEAGEVENYDVVITATGILHHPSIPDFDGKDTFEGASFHTARWDHSVDYKGKRVAVIGTGSTSAQIVGAITEDVAHLSLFQRTPQWMLPLPQTKYSNAYRWLLRTFPFLMIFVYYFHYRALEYTFSEATVGNKFMQRIISWLAKRNLEKNVTDPELRKKLTPDYQAACKRMIFCSDFYPAISRPNAALVTEGIERIEPKGVRTKDGVLHEVDIIVYATGFDTHAFVLPIEVYGEDKQSLRDAWDGAPRAHRAMSMPGFPNYWMIEGPTGPVGNLSLVLISEHQIAYIIKALDLMKKQKLAAIAPRKDAFDAYNKAMAKDINGTIWVTGGCRSWYFDKSGQPNLYPWAPRRFFKEMRNPDFSEYRLIEEIPKQADVVAAE